MRKCRYFIVFIVFLISQIACKVVISQERDTLNILDLSLDKLMNLQISSAAKKAESIVDIPASIFILTRKDIQDQGWRTLEEVLCNVPGMYMINDYLWFGTDNFGVRGFFSTGSFNTMIIMVNGVSQKEDWYNSFPISKINVPVEAIDRIEVIRGPMSVVYGNNAFLGAINIVTNQQTSSNLVSAGGGNNRNYKAFARVAGESNKFKFTFNTSMYGSDGINRPYSEMTDNIDNSWGLPLNARSKGQLTDNRKYFDLSLSYDNFYVVMSQTNTKRGVIDYYPGFDDGHLAEIQSSNTLFGYSPDLSKTVKLRFEVGYYSFRNRLGYKHNSDTTAYGFNDIYSDAASAEINLTYKPNDRLDVIIGSYHHLVFRDKLVVDAPNLSDDYVNLDAGLSRDNRKQTYALFSQVNYSFTKNISALAGLRLEQTPSYKINYAVRFDPTNTYEYLARQGTYKYGDPYLIPRLALMYHFNENHHLKLMYGMAIKQASMGENMDIVRYPDREQLKPATMQTIEMNYIGLISSKAIFNVSLFQNNVNNLISRTNQIENGVMRLFNTNSGKLRTQGIEVRTQLKLNSSFNSSLSIVAQNSKNLQKGYDNITLEYAPQLLAYTTLSYKIHKNISIALSGYYVGKMEAYWRPDARDLTNPNDNRDALQLIKDGKRIGNASPSYLLLNVNARINNLFDKNIYINAFISNLLNTEIRYPTTRSNDEFEKGTLGYSRYFTLSVGVYLNTQNKNINKIED